MKALSHVAFAICAAAWVLLASSPSWGLVIDTYIPWSEGEANPNTDLVNDSAPADDPVWSNLTDVGGVYLGDQWFLSAWHVVEGSRTLNFAGGTFEPIPGTVSRLVNPSGMDANSDLVMYRVGVDQTTGLTPEELDPTIRQITVADSLAPTSEELLMFGRGRTRVLNSTPQVDPTTGDRISQYYYFNSSGSGVAEPVAGGYTGYGVTSSSANTWQWGTNRRSGGNITIEGSVLDTRGFLVRFDENGTEFEAQGAGSDSGGPVFWKDGDQWVLAGLLHGIYYPNGAPADNDLLWTFGAGTGISDLSYSRYYDQIEEFRTQAEYGLLGDVDLDGIVTGDLVDDLATGDLGVLVDNWLQEFDEANIHSWMAGDLNQDATVDLADFVLMRSALGGSISTTAFSQALALAAIPEPSALALALMAAAGVARRR